MEEHGRSGAYRVLIDITTDKRPFEVVLQNFGSFEPRNIHVIKQFVKNVKRSSAQRNEKKACLQWGI